MKLYSAILLSFLLACGSSAAENTTPDEQNNPGVLADYFALKDQLVKTDAVAAAKAAEKLVASLKAAKADNSQVEAASLIAQSKDVEAQRAAFKTLTDKLLEDIRQNKPGQTVYVQYCPMAFGNTGASWLSDSKEVLNPYFGNRMLRCGRVKEEIKN